MIVGPRGSGKSSLANWLNDSDRPLKKSEDVIYGAHTIDVPASYLDNRWMARTIIAICQNHGKGLLLLVDATSAKHTYSYGFARIFNIPVLGVITRVDDPQADLALARREIRHAGIASAPILVDFQTGRGLPELREALITSGLIGKEG